MAQNELVVKQIARVSLMCFECVSICCDCCDLSFYWVDCSWRVSNGRKECWTEQVDI